MSFDNLHAALDAKSSNSETSVIVLPPHHGCSSHTLSLLADNDIHEGLKENMALKRPYNSTQRFGTVHQRNVVKLLRMLFIEDLCDHARQDGTLSMALFVYLKHCERT